MKKTKILLPIYLIISLVLIIGAVVVSLTAGINLGIDFAGGKQIEIKLNENQSTAGYPEKINHALKNFDLVIDSSFTQDKYTETYYVIKINHQEAMSDEEKLELRTAIATELGINVDNVGSVSSISGNVTEKTFINISIAIACIFVLIFVASWIRYGLMNGLSALFNALHTMIISFALVLLTRLELNIPTCIAILVTNLFSIAMFTILLEHVRESMNLKQNKDLTNREIYTDANKKTYSAMIIVSVALVVFALASLFSPMTSIQLFSLALIETTIVAIYSYSFVGFEIGSYLSDVQSIRDKQRTSKNVITKSSKSKNKI